MTSPERWWRMEAMPPPWTMSDSGTPAITGPLGTLEFADGRLSWDTTGGRGEVLSHRLTSLEIGLPRVRPWVRRALWPLTIIAPQGEVKSAAIEITIEAQLRRYEFSLGVPERPYKQRAAASLEMMLVGLEEQCLLPRIGEVQNLIRYIQEVDRVIKPWTPDLSLRAVKKAARESFT